MLTVVSGFAGVGMPGRLVPVCLGAAVAGFAFVVGMSGRVDISGAGIAFALASAGMYTLYLLGVERTMKRTSSVVASMWVSAAAAAAIAVYAFVVRGVAGPHGARQWWPVIGTGVFPSGAFFTL